MPEIVISDTSCLIVLSKIGELDLLRKRYSRVLIPSEVEKEFGNALPDWILVLEPSSISRAQVAHLNIDPGEKAAIALALDVPGSLLILDDEKARHAAERFHLIITGTLGILVKAKKAGLLQSIKPLIDQIMETDFRLSSTIVQQALSEAGEV
jgi:predicted nucleic acid-binding protein